jgi:heme-degrading monooxygenase HmoA
MSDIAKPKRAYRVDKFLVPDASREEHMVGVRRTHDHLKTLPGFMQDLLIEKRAGPDHYNLMTIVEWESEEAFQNAIVAMKAWQAGLGIDREGRWKRLGITPELGDYHTLQE